MAKHAPTATLEKMLDFIATGIRYDVCSSEPSTRAAAVTASLATTTLSAGDFTKAAGDVSGRKVTVAAKAGIDVTATGTANHIAISDGSNLLYVTTCTSQALTTGNKVDLGAWAVEVRAPA
ncbi:MAG: hypothetical protein LC679_06985 [Intrasporangiaceae bacterium]|nr:hypothetical protein [Intrasporangiaceae bacterium]